MRRISILLAVLALSGCGTLGIGSDDKPKKAAAPVVPAAPIAAPLASDGEYVVARGDTLRGIARRHNVAPAELTVLNGIRDPNQIPVGQRLLLPKGAEPGAGAPRLPANMDAAPPPLAAPRQAVTIATLPPPGSAPIAPTRGEALPALPLAPSVAVAPPAAPPVQPPALAPLPAAVKPPPREGTGFLRPVEGRVVSSFGVQAGGQQNDGINIAAARGTPVRAAEAGIVAYAGSEVRGFGNLVLLRHAEGYVTSYAHLDKVSVQKGEKVIRGQKIGTLGSTGNVTSPQLHFEIRKGREAQDPEKLLAASGREHERLASALPAPR